MAYQYNSSVWGRIRPKIQQWESVSGRRVSPGVLREWIDAELSQEANKANASRGLDIQQGQLDLNREKAKNEASAAKYSGVGQLATTGMGLYGLGKEAGLWGGASATTPGATTTGMTGLSASGSVGGIGATAPTIAGGGAQAQLTTPAISTLANGTTAAEGTIGTGATASGTGTGIGGLGLGAGLGAVGLAGAAGGMLGSKLSENDLVQKTTPWGGEKTERMAGSVGVGMGAGALVGSQIGSIGGPWGAGIGAVVGGIVGAVGGGCIIVTACHGKDSEEVNITREYRDTFMNKDQIRGYYMIAESIVPSMEKSEELTKLIKVGLVDKLIEYGKFHLGYSIDLSKEAAEIADAFLDLCNVTGQSVGEFTRANGEVI